MPPVGHGVTQGTPLGGNLTRPNATSIRHWYKIFSELHRFDLGGPTPGSQETWLDPLLNTVVWLDMHAAQIDEHPFAMYKEAILPVLFEERGEFIDPGHSNLINSFLSTYGTPYQQYLIDPAAQPNLSTVVTDSNVTLVGETMRLAFPFVSSFALWTDKVGLFKSGTPEIISGNQAVTWYNPDANDPMGAPLEIAVYVTKFDRDANVVEAVIHNFGAPRDIGIQFGSDFQEGTYRVKYGPANDQGAWNANVDFGETISLKGPGEKFVLHDSTVPNGILPTGARTKVRVARVGRLVGSSGLYDLPSERMDLAVNLLDFSSAMDTVTIHNLGSADYLQANGAAELVFTWVGGVTGPPPSISPAPVTIPLAVDLIEPGDLLLSQSAVVTLPYLIPGDWKLTIVASESQEDWTRVNNVVRFTMP